MHRAQTLVSATLLLALAAVVGPSWAQAGEGPQAERLHHRRAPTISKQGYEKSTFFFEGTLEQGPDGQVFLDNPVTRTTRQRISEARQIPLRAVPSVLRRRVLVAPDGPSAREIKRRLGQRVRAELVRDRSGHAFLRALRAPRR